MKMDFFFGNEKYLKKESFRKQKNVRKISFRKTSISNIEISIGDRRKLNAKKVKKRRKITWYIEKKYKTRKK